MRVLRVGTSRGFSVWFVFRSFNIHSSIRTWAAAVIGLSHVLLPQSLNMTADWWWFQRLRVMTTLSLFMISFCNLSFLSLPFFFSLLFCVPSSERKSAIPLNSAWWQTASALSPSVREAVGGGAAAWTLGKMCVCGSPGWIIHNFCWAGGDSQDFPTICDVCVFMVSAVLVRIC